MSTLSPTLKDYNKQGNNELEHITISFSKTEIKELERLRTAFIKSNNKPISYDNLIKFLILGMFKQERV